MPGPGSRKKRYPGKLTKKQRKELRKKNDFKNAVAVPVFDYNIEKQFNQAMSRALTLASQCVLASAGNSIAAGVSSLVAEYTRIVRYQRVLGPIFEEIGGGLSIQGSRAQFFRDITEVNAAGLNLVTPTPAKPYPKDILHANLLVLVLWREYLGFLKDMFSERQYLLGSYSTLQHLPDGQGVGEKDATLKVFQRYHVLVNVVLIMLMMHTSKSVFFHTAENSSIPDSPALTQFLKLLITTGKGAFSVESIPPNTEQKMAYVELFLLVVRGGYRVTAVKKDHVELNPVPGVGSKPSLASVFKAYARLNHPDRVKSVAKAAQASAAT